MNPLDLSLLGKIAVITGANRGIGRAIALQLAEQGASVVLSARDEARLAEVLVEVRNLQRAGIAIALDLRLPSSAEQLVSYATSAFGRVDILINNAGIGQPNLPLAKLPYHQWKSVVDTNLTGMFLVTREMLPLMRKGGIIANNLSIAAERVFAGSSAYNASKHGALGLTDTLREELRSAGIRVIALLPGATDTNIWETLWPEAPRKKMMSAETVAQALVTVLILPEDSTVEELTIMPAAGTL